MKKIATKEVYRCETFMEVVNAYIMGDTVYYKDDNEGQIRSIYVEDDCDNPPIKTEEDAKNAIGIYNLDANFQESVDHYDAQPSEFYVEVTI